MKHFKSMVAFTMAMLLLTNFSSYASVLNGDSVFYSRGKCVVLDNGELSSRGEYGGVTRGDFLATGVTQITNGQDGSIIISIDTYAHHDVDSIFHTVFLDQWDADDEDWYQVNSWNFVEYKEDKPNGKLSDLLSVITVTGYETNKYYRVRGLHGVEYNDEIEAFATETDGVLLTDRS